MSVVTNIPPSQPYTGGYTSFGAACNPPVGQPSWGAFNFDWTNVTQATPGYTVDFSQFPNMPRQVSTCYVDNSRSHQAVTIIFTDTGHKLVVKPFVRGYYTVLTKGTQFYIGINDFTGTSFNFDHTAVAMLDFFVPPQEQEISLVKIPLLETFDPSGSTGTVIIRANINDQFLRLRSGYLQLSNMQAGGAGFNATFELIADTGITAVRADLEIFAGGVVDAGYLWQADSELDVAGTEWQYSWTVNGGALTGPGQANLMPYFDFAGSF